MSRKTNIEQAEFPYHLTARCINKEWFDLPMEMVWRVAEEQLFFLQRAFNFKLHAFVLMNNHFHLLASTPNLNLGTGMAYFMREMTRQINFESGRINQMWGGRYFRSMISNPHYYLHAYKYVYRNPVQEQMALDVLEYRYSSLRGLLGFEKILFTVEDNTLFEMNPESCIRWLNESPNNMHWSAVERGLKKSQFKLGKCEKTKKEFSIEYDML